MSMQKRTRRIVYRRMKKGEDIRMLSEGEGEGGDRGGGPCVVGIRGVATESEMCQLALILQWYLLAREGEPQEGMINEVTILCKEVNEICAKLQKLGWQAVEHLE
jgi:hypothetical protein